MLKHKNLSKFLSILLVIQIFFFASSPLVIAKADDLVIEDNGAVNLVITENSVLAETTKAPNAPTNAPAPAPPAPAAPAPAPKNTVQKVVPVAPANSQTTVKISPNTSPGTSTSPTKKMTITIETTKPSVTTTTVPSSPAASSRPNLTLPAGSPTVTPGNVTSVQKTVENVILKGANDQPVVTIKPDQATTNQIDIQQQNENAPVVSANTGMQVNIDAQKHTMSVETTGGTKQVSVLPDQVVKAVNEIAPANAPVPTNTTKVTLTQESGHAEYVVNQETKGKLLGIVNVTLPSQVKISAETGKLISTNQPLAFSFVKFLLRK